MERMVRAGGKLSRKIDTSPIASAAIFPVSVVAMPPRKRPAKSSAPSTVFQDITERRRIERGAAQERSAAEHRPQRLIDRTLGLLSGRPTTPSTATPGPPCSATRPANAARPATTCSSPCVHPDDIRARMQRRCRAPLCGAGREAIESSCGMRREGRRAGLDQGPSEGDRATTAPATRPG